jgi:hypothetical protein
MLYQKKFRTTELTLIDGDSFEDRNAERQSFSRRGNKAEVTAEEIRKTFPSLYVWTAQDFLSDANIAMSIREGDVVFSCVDNHATRLLLSNRASSLEDVLLISGGNDLVDGNCQIHYRRGGVDLTLPIANKYHPEILIPKDVNPGARPQGCGQRVRSDPQLLVTNMYAATLMMAAFQYWLDGGFDSDKKYDEVYFSYPLNKSLPRVRNKE